MAYTTIDETEFVYFSSEEREKIEGWLSEKGHKWQTNNVCGDCCGMYEDEYWVNGIGGDFSNKEEFVDFAKENSIGCKVEGHTIQAYDGEANLGNY